jgi:transposase
MGYRGKVVEKERARELRGGGFTMLEIATQLNVSKSSVSLWTREVELTPRERESGRFGARNRGPNARQRRKAAEIDRLDADAISRLGTLGEQVSSPPGRLSMRARAQRVKARSSSPTVTRK